MGFQLRDDVHWCNDHGRAVFLDIEADRYFCLPAASNHAFLRLAAGRPCDGDSDRLRVLQERGILVQAPDGAPFPGPPRLEAPAGDIDPGACLLLFPLLRQLASELMVAFRLRTTRFAGVIRRARLDCSAPSPGPCVGSGAIEAIAAAAAGISPILSTHDRCLVRALAVHRLCIRRGIRPKLVFGVVAHPFAAHCWVQLGNRVIVGGFEQARLYTPILVVG